MRSFTQSCMGVKLWTIFEIQKNMDLGIPMKVVIQSDRSNATSLTDRWARGPRTEHIDARYFGVQERVKFGDLNSKGCLQQNIARMLERSPSLFQFYNHFASLQNWCSTDSGSHTPPLDIPGIIATERRKRQWSAVVVMIEKGAKLSETF